MKDLVRYPNVINVNDRSPVNWLCLNENSSSSDHATTGIFLKNEAVSFTAKAATLLIPTVSDPITDIISANTDEISVEVRASRIVSCAGFIILGRYFNVFPLGINFWNSHNTPFGTDRNASPFSNPEIMEDTAYNIITESRNIIFDCILLLNISLLVNFIKFSSPILLIYFLMTFSC